MAEFKKLITGDAQPGTRHIRDSGTSTCCDEYVIGLQLMVIDSYGMWFLKRRPAGVQGDP